MVGSPQWRHRMKAPRWLVLFWVGGMSAIGACAPDAPMGSTLPHSNPANVYSYTYLCELGTPGYEMYCEDYGSAGANGTAYLPCPGGMAVNACHQFDATLTALIASGDAGCANAAQAIRNEVASGTFVFKDTVVIDPKSGKHEDAGTAVGVGYTELYDDAFDYEYDIDYQGDPTKGFLDVNFDLAATFAHEYTHQTGNADEDLAEQAGQYCAQVLRTQQLDSYPAPMWVHPVPRSGDAGASVHSPSGPIDERS